MEQAAAFSSHRTTALKMPSAPDIVAPGPLTAAHVLRAQDVASLLHVPVSTVYANGRVLAGSPAVSAASAASSFAPRSSAGS